jgi:hypothetical protein
MTFIARNDALPYGFHQEPHIDIGILSDCRISLHNGEGTGHSSDMSITAMHRGIL